ncbi:MAG TPA: biopolymer transporter ExbD [Myxococcota bacterium]|nr:biopolymer transporter ExbD [Myxococcota bacterium]
MKLRRQRRPRRGRIEIIPMIDVMFFLLATFMLASLTMQNIHSLKVDLPVGHAEPARDAAPVTLGVARDGALSLNDVSLSLDDLAQALKPLLGGDDNVVVAADAGAPEGAVVQAMIRARDAGARHFLIAVRRD